MKPTNAFLRSMDSLGDDDLFNLHLHHGQQPPPDTDTVTVTVEAPTTTEQMFVSFSQDSFEHCLGGSPLPLPLALASQAQTLVSTPTPTTASSEDSDLSSLFSYSFPDMTSTASATTTTTTPMATSTAATAATAASPTATTPTIATHNGINITTTDNNLPHRQSHSVLGYGSQDLLQLRSPSHLNEELQQLQRQDQQYRLLPPRTPELKSPRNNDRLLRELRLASMKIKELECAVFAFRQANPDFTKTGTGSPQPQHQGRLSFDGGPRFFHTQASSVHTPNGFSQTQPPPSGSGNQNGLPLALLQLLQRRASMPDIHGFVNPGAMNSSDLPENAMFSRNPLPQMPLPQTTNGDSQQQRHNMANGRRMSLPLFVRPPTMNPLSNAIHVNVETQTPHATINQINNPNNNTTTTSEMQNAAVQARLQRRRSSGGLLIDGVMPIQIPSDILQRRQAQVMAANAGAGLSNVVSAAPQPLVVGGRQPKTAGKATVQTTVIVPTTNTSRSSSMGTPSPSSSSSSTSSTSTSGNTKSDSVQEKDLRVFISSIRRYTAKEREARIERFKFKKLSTNFGKKKVRYECRKRLADNRPRFRGRFCKTNKETSLTDTDMTNSLPHSFANSLGSTSLPSTSAFGESILSDTSFATPPGMDSSELLDSLLSDL